MTVATMLRARPAHLLDGSVERARQELTLQTALGVPLVATKGYAAPAAGEAYTRARELCQRVEETPQLFPVLVGLFRFYGSSPK